MCKRRIIVRGAVMLVIVVVATLGYLVVWGPEVRFHSESWQAEPRDFFRSHKKLTGGDNLRARMVGDVLDSHLRLGMSSEAVKEILGRYDSGGNGITQYRLMPMPTTAQKVVAFVRWRTTDPHLELEFNGNYPGQHLVRIQVGDW